MGRWLCHTAGVAASLCVDNFVRCFMAERVVSYVCPYCEQLFKSAHSCQRHLSRSHTGHPVAYPTIVLLHGRHGPEDGFAHLSSDAAVRQGVAAGDAEAEAPVLDSVEGGAYDMEDAPPLLDASVMSAATAASTDGVKSICGRVLELYERFDDAASSRPLHAESALRPSRFDSPFCQARFVTRRSQTGRALRGHHHEACGVY